MAKVGVVLRKQWLNGRLLGIKLPLLIRHGDSTFIQRRGLVAFARGPVIGIGQITYGTIVARIQCQCLLVGSNGVIEAPQTHVSLTQIGIGLEARAQRKSTLQSTDGILVPAPEDI